MMNNVSRHTFPVTYLGFQKAVSNLCLADASLRQFADHELDQTIFRFEVQVVSGQPLEEERRKTTEFYDIPKTWWQQFKHENFPDWLLKWFPVETRQLVSYTQYADVYTKVCPHIHIPEGSRAHVAFMLGDPKED